MANVDLRNFAENLESHRQIVPVWRDTVKGVGPASDRWWANRIPEPLHS
jgi:hypothetical protein